MFCWLRLLLPTEFCFREGLVYSWYSLKDTIWERKGWVT